MRCRLILRAALFVALACSFGVALCADARADVECAVAVRHLPAPGTEAPGTVAITLTAETPQSVAAEWEAYTDRGFLRATLPVVQLAKPDAGSSPTAWARSRTIVVRIPDGSHVYESWLRTVGTDVCAPPAYDPVHSPKFTGTFRDANPTPDPADGAVDAIVAPGLERMDCPSPFIDAHVAATSPAQYPKGANGTGPSLVKVVIGPDGRIADATIYRSSGNVLLDKAALRSAVSSTFTAPVAFCRPTFGSYIFHVDFP